MYEVKEGIVAGYDGSPASGQAVRWAVREARARDTTLTVCLAWAPEDIKLPAGSAVGDMVRQHGKEILLTEGLPYAESALGPSRVHAALADGPAAQVLCEYSHGVGLMVVGARGHGELRGLLLGSVSWQVAAHAEGRVVVVRGPWRPANQSPGPVVVGVDGSRAARAALAFAMEEAVLRNVPLVAVCALADAPARLGDSRALAAEFGRVMDDAEQAHPEVTVVREVVPGSARAALLDEAAGAQMVVMGARGRGGLDAMSLGSVAQAVLQHAPCPVGIVHPAA